MPETLRPDRLSREELVLLQRKALRSWKDSDWLAQHHPRSWLALEERNPNLVAVDLGAELGEANQTPGAIALGEPRPDPESDMDQRPRTLDLFWNVRDGLPFEDATVGHVVLRPTIPRSPFLAREIARALELAGTVQLGPDEPQDFLQTLKDHGLEAEDDPTMLRKVTQHLNDTSPLRIREMVLGELKIPDVRRPIPP